MKELKGIGAKEDIKAKVQSVCVYEIGRERERERERGRETVKRKQRNQRALKLRLNSTGELNF